MLIKQGVVMCFLNDQIRTALAVIQEVYEGLLEEPVCTAGCDGNHKVNSKHYVNDAVDLRLPHKDNIPLIVAQLKAKLGSKFYVLLEVDHIHVQYGQPTVI